MLNSRERRKYNNSAAQKAKAEKSRLIAAFTLNFIKTKRRRLKTKRRQRVLQRLMQEQKFPPFNFTPANSLFP